MTFASKKQLEILISMIYNLGNYYSVIGVIVISTEMNPAQKNSAEKGGTVYFDDELLFSDSADFKSAIAGCFDSSDFIKVISEAEEKNKNHFFRWSEYYKSEMKRLAITDTMVVGATGTSFTTAKRFKKRAPASRRHVLEIAGLFGYNFREANSLLSAAGYSRLYSKTIDDCIWIYMLNGESIGNAQKQFEIIRTDIMDELSKKIESGNSPQHHVNRRKIQNPDDVEGTGSVYFSLLNNIDSYSKFVEFILNNYEVFDTSFVKLRLEILNSIKKFDPDNRYNSQKHKFANSSFKGNDKFRKRHYREIEDKINEGYPPTREYLIALALHLNCPLYELENMLVSANYDNLSALDILEAAIIYIYNDFGASVPALLYEESDLRTDESMERTINEKGLAACIKEELLSLAEKSVDFSSSEIKFQSFIDLL